MNYLAYGLAFSSAARFPELTEARGAEPTLAFSVRRQPFVADRSWRAFPLRVESDGTPWLTVLAREGAYALRFAAGADFVIDRDARDVVGYAPPGTPTNTIRHLFVDQALPLILARQGHLVLHGSAVDCFGAVVFLGATGAGKSTIAAAFGRAGVPVLADDVSRVGRVEGRLHVWPAYAGVRVWPDALGRLGRPGRTVRVADYTRKQRIGGNSHDLVFGARAAPLRRFYVLSPSQASGPRQVLIQPLSRREAAIELVKHSYLFDLTDGLVLAQHLDRVARELTAVPTSRIAYRRDLETLECLRTAIADDLGRS